MSNITAISHHPLANETLSALEATSETVQTNTAASHGYSTQDLDGVPTLLQLGQQYGCVEQSYSFTGSFDRWLMGFHFCF